MLHSLTILRNKLSTIFKTEYWTPIANFLKTTCIKIFFDFSELRVIYISVNYFLDIRYHYFSKKIKCAKMSWSVEFYTATWQLTKNLASPHAADRHTSTNFKDIENLHYSALEVPRKCTPDGHWFSWNVHGKFQNPVISLEDSNLRLMVTLELSNGIAWFWNIPCTFHANQRPSSVRTKTLMQIVLKNAIFSLSDTRLVIERVYKSPTEKSRRKPASAIIPTLLPRPRPP